MKRTLILIIAYVFVTAGCLGIARMGSRAVTVMIETAPIPNRICYIIDAGHGGVDGGATSCTGVLESQLNLEIALRLESMMQFLGCDTRMIRRTDTSIYTEGETIAAKKVSDLKQRVKIVNETENAVLISIHQNTFPDSRYHGPQVFYADNEISETVAQKLQTQLVSALDPDSNRKCKSSSGIYLMRNILKPGILIECGFLTNPEEEARLRAAAYQKKLVSIIAVSVSRQINQENM